MPLPPTSGKQRPNLNSRLPDAAGGIAQAELRSAMPDALCQLGVSPHVSGGVAAPA
jgi:hypothetical protein